MISILFFFATFLIIGITSLAITSGGKYRAQLQLTELGKAAADHVEQRAQLAVEEAGTGMSEEQRTVMYEALGLIAGNLQMICAQGLK